MSLEVRAATAADLTAVLVLDPLIATTTARRAWLAGALAGETGRVASIAMLDGVAAGFSVIGEFFSNPFLELIVAGQAFRRQGVATALMEALEAAHLGAKIFVSTNRSNTVMQALLTNRGYLFAGQIDYLDPGDPEMFFVRLP